MDIRPILSSLRRHRTAAALIVLQVALTCAIVCNALFLIQQRVERMGMDSGLAEDELVLIQPVSLRGAADGAEHDASPDIERTLALLRGIPGVTSVAAVPQMPFGNSSNYTSVSNKPDQAQPTLNAALYMDGEGMLEAFGLNLVAGRDFSPEEYVHVDDMLQQRAAIPGVIVNRAAAERLFPGEDALGRLTYGWGDGGTPIIGIVEQLAPPNSFELGQYSVIYPIRNYYHGLHYVLRTAPERRVEVLEAAQATLRADDPGVIILNQGTFEELRARFFRQDRAMIWMLAVVCLALLLVTALGIVGLASFWVAQRTRQIGVRRALGANRAQITRYFQVENFLLASAGIVLGMLLAFALNQYLMGRYELPRLPIAYLPVGAIVLWLLGQAAVLGPARRAAAVPPAIATRSA